MTAHITLARESGAKAGFKAYMASHTPTAAARRAEIREAGNAKAQFAAYCAIFSDQLGRTNGEAAVRSESQVEDVSEAGLLADFRAWQASRRARKNVGVQVEAEEAPVEETPSEEIVATHITWPMVATLISASKAFGETLTINGKDGGKGTGRKATYSITFGDDVLDGTNPEDCLLASAIIDEYKNLPEDAS